jgi:hypothetical protein
MAPIKCQGVVITALGPKTGRPKSLFVLRLDTSSQMLEKFHKMGYDRLLPRFSKFVIISSVIRHYIAPAVKESK